MTDIHNWPHIAPHESATMDSRPRVVNPYAKSRPLVALRMAQNSDMGRQSQQRVSQAKRAYQLASSSRNANKKKKQKGDQLTLHGQTAFQSERNCQVCRAQALARIVAGARIPKRPHHVLCIKNTKTKGKGQMSQQNIATAAEEKRLSEHFNAPLAPHEKGSSRHATPQAAAQFFAPRKITNPKPPPSPSSSHLPLQQVNFCEAVSNMVADASFREKHQSKSAPLAILAFATDVVEKVVRNKDESIFDHYFNGLTITVPQSTSAFNNPHYHSIIGQKLLLVDWKRAFGINPPCPDSTCRGVLTNIRTHFSKNKTLFPIFGLGGAPSWCIVMKMGCPCCKRQFDSNDAAILLSLPAYIASHYPVEPKYALSNHSFHLAIDATNVLDSIMLTYANGDLCSRLLYTAINKAYMERITGYLSYNKENPQSPVKVHDYIQKNGTFVKQFPPLGDTIRDIYDKAATTNNNRWGISDHDRHTRSRDAKCQVRRRNLRTRSYLRSH
jgi:hypothetical protein